MILVASAAINVLAFSGSNVLLSKLSGHGEPKNDGITQPSNNYKQHKRNGLDTDKQN